MKGALRPINANRLYTDDECIEDIFSESGMLKLKEHQLKMKEVEIQKEQR